MDLLKPIILEEKYRSTFSQKILSVLIINFLKLIKSLNKDVCELTNNEIIKFIEIYEKLKNPKHENKNND